MEEDVIQSKMRSKLLVALGAAIMAVALLAPAAQAVKPAPPYEQFAGCPSLKEVPTSEICVHSVITSGHFQMGNKNVPITNPITLTGGVDENLQNFSANSEGGLRPVKQLVPGGIIGLTGLDWLVNFLGLEDLKLYAVTELAGAPSNFSITSVTLPVRVHLINPVLGSSCYVGSFSNPIVLNLSTETTNPPPPNKPITGKFAKFSIDEVLNIVHLDNGIFVDNAFAAPGANGCKLTLFGFLPISINGLVNSQSGLPSPAGTNETIQEFDTELVGSFFVYP
jgi:hypothetical protein